MNDILNSFKPAPFVILDEVDSALDNLNVLRLAQYLNRASQGLPPIMEGQSTAKLAIDVAEGINTLNLQSHSPKNDPLESFNPNRKTQCIVISLKNLLYEQSSSLVGIYKDHEGNTSKILTLNLTNYGV